MYSSFPAITTAAPQPPKNGGRVFTSILFICLLTHDFSVTEILGLPRSPNIFWLSLALLLFQITTFRIPLNKTLVAASIGATGFLTCIIIGYYFGRQTSFKDFFIPIYLLSIPALLYYWNALPPKRKRTFILTLTITYFLYAAIQYIALKSSGIDLLIHRFTSDYQIPNYAQDTPFKYLTLDRLHDFAFKLGAGVTAFFGERVNFALYCITIIYASLSTPKGTFTVLEKTTLLFLPILFLTFSGSGLSVFTLLIPLLLIQKQIPSLTLHIHYRNHANSVIFLELTLVLIVTVTAIYFSLPWLSDLIRFFDDGRRLNGLFSIAAYTQTENLDIPNLLFGWTYVSTQDIGTASNAFVPEQLNRGLSVFGYITVGYGLLGLASFTTSFFLMLYFYSGLSLIRCAIPALLLFIAAGSPLNSIYVLALLIFNTYTKLSPNHQEIYENRLHNNLP